MTPSKQNPALQQAPRDRVPTASRPRPEDRAAHRSLTASDRVPPSRGRGRGQTSCRTPGRGRTASPPTTPQRKDPRQHRVNHSKHHPNGQMMVTELTGMPQCPPVARTYTQDQKTQALDLWTTHGACEAARQTGIPQRTISSWARRAGLQSDAPAKTRQATERAAQRWALIRAGLSDELGQAAVEALAMLRGDVAAGKSRNARDGAAAVGLLISNAQELADYSTSVGEAGAAGQRDVIDLARERAERLAS